MTNVVFTGPAKFRGGVFNGVHVTRDILTEIATSSGMRVQSTVTPETDFVVCTDPAFKNRQGRKLRAADALGVPTVLLEEFLQRVVIDTKAKKEAA